MALKTLHFVQGLSRTPLLFIPRYLTNIFFENISQQKNLETRKSENLKFQKTQVTNKCPVGRRIAGLEDSAQCPVRCQLGRW